MLTYYLDRRDRCRDRQADRAEAEQVRREDRAESERIRREYRREAERIRREDRADAERIRREDRADAERIRREDRADAERRHHQIMTALLAILERNRQRAQTNQSAALEQLDQRLTKLEAEVALLRSGGTTGREVC